MRAGKEKPAIRRSRTPAFFKVQMTFVPNSELKTLSVSSWPRVLFSLIFSLTAAGLMGEEYGAYFLPIFIVCICFSLWSVGMTISYLVLAKRGMAMFPAPISRKDKLFARLIVKGVIGE